MSQYLDKRTLEYLYEIASFPEEMRLKYLYALSKRKNGETQKNVLILKRIYRCIGKQDFFSWNEEKLCRELKISRAMLACHKCRILKKLRDMYFNPGSAYRKVSIESANRLFKRGMGREAALMLFKLKEDAESRKSLKELPAIYFLLCECYGRKKNINSFNIFLDKYNCLFLKFKRTGFRGFSPDLKNTLTAQYTVLNAQRYFLYENFKPNIRKIIKLYTEGLKASAKIRDKSLYFRALSTLAQIYRVQGDLQRAKKYIEEGLKAANEVNFKDEGPVFRMFMLELLFRENPFEGRKYLKEAEEIYELYKELPDFNSDYLLRMIIVLSRFYTYFNASDKLAETDAKLLECFNIYGFKYEYHNRRYLYYSDIYFDSIINWRKNSSPAEGMPLLGVDVNRDSLDKLERLNGEILYTGINISKATLGIAYLNRIEIEFWKGTGCDFIQVNYYLKKIKRLLRSRLFFTVKSLWLSTNKLLLAIIEDSAFKKSKDIYEQRFPEIKEYFRALKNDTEGVNILIEYAKILFAADVLNHDEFRKFAGSFEKWLMKNRKELIEPVVRSPDSAAAA